jgi:NhaP-type Na+/H+ or K+/H+ antiporter
MKASNHLATALTLLIMLATAIACDRFYLNPHGNFGAVLLFAVMFGPISFLLWRKENLRDYDPRALLRFCLKGMLGAIGVGAAFASLGLLGDRLSHQGRDIKADVFGIMMTFLVVGGLIPVFVALTFLRLGIKILIERLFGQPRS